LLFHTDKTSPDPDVVTNEIDCVGNTLLSSHQRKGLTDHSVQEDIVGAVEAQSEQIAGDDDEQRVQGAEGNASLDEV